MRDEVTHSKLVTNLRQEIQGKEIICQDILTVPTPSGRQAEVVEPLTPRLQEATLITAVLHEAPLVRESEHREDVGGELAGYTGKYSRRCISALALDLRDFVTNDHFLLCFGELGHLPGEEIDELIYTRFPVVLQGAYRPLWSLSIQFTASLSFNAYLNSP